MSKEEWMKLYFKLTNFLRNNKHYPQINSKDDNEKILAIFVREQREEYKAKTLEYFKEKLLNEINFCWAYDKVKHDESLETWQAYEESYVQKLINNNGNRATKPTDYKSSKLSEWELKQRKEEKRGGLNEDREYELEKVGFYFDDSSLPKNQRRSFWFKNYNKLIELLKSVGGDYDELKTLPEFKSISKWFMQQIDEEQKGGLEDDRKYLLDNISFPFESKYKKWTD